jgi:hypothetical protein
MSLVHKHGAIDHYNANWNQDENQFRPVRKQSFHIPDHTLNRSNNRHSTAWTLLFGVIHRNPETAFSARPLIYAPLDHRVYEQQGDRNEYGQE